MNENKRGETMEKDVFDDYLTSPLPSWLSKLVNHAEHNFIMRLLIFPFLAVFILLGSSQ